VDHHQEKSRPIEEDVGIQEHRYKIYTSTTCLYHGRTETTTCWDVRTVVVVAAVHCYTLQPCDVGIAAAVLLLLPGYYHVEMMVLSYARDRRIFDDLLALRDGFVQVCELSVTIVVDSIVLGLAPVSIVVIVVVDVAVDDIGGDAPAVPAVAACSMDDDSRVALVVLVLLPLRAPPLLFCWGIELRV